MQHLPYARKCILLYIYTFVQGLKIVPKINISKQSLKYGRICIKVGRRWSFLFCFVSMFEFCILNQSSQHVGEWKRVLSASLFNNTQNFCLLSPLLISFEVYSLIQNSCDVLLNFPLKLCHINVLKYINKVKEISSFYIPGNRVNFNFVSK